MVVRGISWVSVGDGDGGFGEVLMVLVRLRAVVRMGVLVGLEMKFRLVLASFCVSIGVRTDVDGVCLIFVEVTVVVELGDSEYVEDEVFRNVV